MIIGIRMEGKFADEELRSLYSWLIRDSELRQNAQVGLASKELDEGAMGTALDAVTLMVTGGLAVPGFVQALRSWQGTRRREYAMTIEVDGVTVNFSEVDESIVSEIRKRLKGDD